MGETASVSAGSASTTSAVPSSAATSTPSSSQSFGSTQSQTAGAGDQQTQSNSNPAPRELGETDLDAIVPITINGKVEKVTLKDLQKAYGLDKAAYQKMEKAAELQRKAEAIMKLDLDTFAKQKGIDLDSLAEERLARRYEEAQMSPEQLELQRFRAEQAERQKIESATKQEVYDALKELGISDADIPEGHEKATVEQLRGFLNHKRQEAQQVQANLEKSFMEAWSTTGLPKHAEFGARMAFAMMNHNKRNAEAIRLGQIQPLQPAQAAAKVKADFCKHVSEIFSTMDAKAIHEMLGKDVMQKIRDYAVEQVTGQNPAHRLDHNNGPGSQMPASPKPKEYVDQFEWRRRMGIA